MSDLSASDVLAMTKSNDSMFGGNGSWFIVLILFFLAMGGFGGFGGNNSATQGTLTRAELYEGLNAQDVKGGLADLGTQVNSNFNNVQLGMNSGFSGIQQSLCSGFSNVNANISNLGHSMETCCCTIRDAVHAEGESTRSLINSINLTNLQSQLDDKNREILAQTLAASQLAQTNSIENYLRTLVNGCGC